MFELIYTHHSQHPFTKITRLCKSVGVSRDGYYSWLKRAGARQERLEKELKLVEQIRSIQAYRGFYKGHRQIKFLLERKLDIVCSRRHILYLMHKYDLFLPRKKRKRPLAPKQERGAQRSNYLINKEFQKRELGELICTDVSYIKISTGFAYLSGAIDVATNMILAYVLSPNQKKEVVQKTFEHIDRRFTKEGCIINTDGGSQYTCPAFNRILSENGWIHSMNHKGCCTENGEIEGFWARLKTEIGDMSHLSFEEASLVIDNYIDYYNSERGQEVLEWRTPKEYAELKR